MKYLEKPFHVAFHFVQVIPVSFKFNVGLQIPFVTAFARPPQWMEVGATFCAETLTLFCILLTSICDVASCLGLMKVLNLDISNKDCPRTATPALIKVDEITNRKDKNIHNWCNILQNGIVSLITYQNRYQKGSFL